MCMQPILASMRQIAVEEKKHDMNSSDHLLRGKEYFQEALGINNTFFQFEKPKQVFLYLYVNLRSVINPVMFGKGNFINEKKNSSLSKANNLKSLTSNLQIKQSPSWQNGIIYLSLLWTFADLLLPVNEIIDRNI